MIEQKAGTQNLTDMKQAAAAALDGLRILDFTRVLAGPFCTMLLADFGAEVIKVERPKLGDDTRHWGPPWAGGGDNKLSAYFISVNRNKRSLTLNLKSAEGQAIARQLALQSDVVIENFKVGQMEDYGLGFDSLYAKKPDLVYCSITGYGQTGLYTERPGYDFVIQGQSGLMSITGEAEGGPHKVGVAISDVVTGLFACTAVQTALLHREKTGQGQHVDISLLDSQIAALVNVMSNYLVNPLQAPKRYGNAHPNIVPYQSFVTSDGALNLAVGNDAQFRNCCAVISRPDLPNEDRFATNPARVAHRDELIGILTPIFKTNTTAYWEDKMIRAGVPAGAIHDMSDVVNDPHVQARNLVQTISMQDGTLLDLLGPTSRLSATPASISSPPPLLGQDTDSILTDLLGMDTHAIADYHAEGIV